jgi:hypothetical protein
MKNLIQSLVFLGFGCLLSGCMPILFGSGAVGGYYAAKNYAIHPMPPPPQN